MGEGWFMLSKYDTKMGGSSVFVYNLDPGISLLIALLYISTPSSMLPRVGLKLFTPTVPRVVHLIIYGGLL